MNTAKTALDAQAARDLVREPKMKTLIIDDDAVNVALLKAMLLDNGYSHIKSITDPRLALEACNRFVRRSKSECVPEFRGADYCA